MSQHKLEVKNLYKKYARRVVVNDVSFSVSAGEIVGLLGPNGAGKTTCFYIACGLVRSSKGEVILDNKSIGHMPIHKRANLGIGYLPQEPSIFRKLSVQDNIMAVLEMNKSILPKDRSRRLEELLSEFKVEHVRHIKGITLSGGERRRVAVTELLNCIFILPPLASTIVQTKSAVLVADVGEGRSCALAVCVATGTAVPSSDIAT